jgi:outer membrane protein OmpA-like peptidoglycan-associated protein
MPHRGYRQPPPGNRTDVELDRLREELEENRAEMDKAREELRRGEIAMQEARVALDRALSEHQQNIDLQHTLGEQFTDATAENVALQSHITQLTTELAAANTSLAQTREQVSVLTGERDQLQNTLSGQSADLTAENTTLQSRITQLTTELTAANTSLAQTREQVSALTGERDQLQNTRNGQLADLTTEKTTLQSRITQLTTELTAANTSLAQTREQVSALTGERDQLQNTLASRDEQLTGLKDELQAATTESQQAKSGVDTFRRELAESQAQAQAYKQRLDDLDARLEDQRQAMSQAKQLMAEMNSARDSLRADLSASTEELISVQTTLAKAQAQARKLSHARRGSIIADVPEQSESVPGDQPVLTESEVTMPEEAVEIAALESEDSSVQAPAEDSITTEPEAETVVAYASTARTGVTDTDRDGIPDSNDLCPATPEAVAVEPTGCAAHATIPLDGVNFRYNSHELTDEARLVLDRLAGILDRQADLRLEVAGHTDSQGNAAYNQWLSQQRAQAVREYLISRGLGAENISARGYGAQQPVADNKTVAGLVRNRRVELRSLP